MLDVGFLPDCTARGEEWRASRHMCEQLIAMFATTFNCIVIYGTPLNFIAMYGTRVTCLDTVTCAEQLAVTAVAEVGSLSWR